jgi:hypothetical protein
MTTECPATRAPLAQADLEIKIDRKRKHLRRFIYHQIGNYSK